MHKHIILIGFKHVGKTAIGKALAHKLQVPFLDLDQQIEKWYSDQHGEKKFCRQIMETEGEEYFRELETQALESIVHSTPSILSVGGGTPIQKENQTMLNAHIIFHITAPRGIVFERIQMSGRPEFFEPQKDLLESFTQLWDEREQVYQNMKHFTIENNSSVDDAVKKIMKPLKLMGEI